MKNLYLFMLAALLCALPALAKPHVMKTHSSKAPGAKVTVIHWGATW